MMKGEDVSLNIIGSGFSTLDIILTVAIVGVIGFVIYKTIKSKKNKLKS